MSALLRRCWLLLPASGFAALIMVAPVTMDGAGQGSGTAAPAASAPVSRPATAAYQMRPTRGVIWLSGNLEGHWGIEPSAGERSGGPLQFSTSFAALPAGRVPFVFADAGEALLPSDQFPRETLFAALWRVQAGTMAELLLAAGLDVANLGAADLAGLGAESAAELARRGMPWLSSTIAPAQGGRYGGLRWQPLGGLTIGWLGLAEAADVEPVPAVTRGDPRPAFRAPDPLDAAWREVEKLKAHGANFIVALSNLGWEASADALRELRAVQVMAVSGESGPDDRVELIDGRLLIATRPRGRSLAKIFLTVDRPATGYAWHLANEYVVRAEGDYLRRREKLNRLLPAAPGQRQEFEKKLAGWSAARDAQLLSLYQFNALSPRGAEAEVTFIWPDPDLPVAAKLEEILARDVGEQRAALKNQGWPKHRSLTARRGGRYAGAESCAACHETAAQWWRNDRHGQAFLTLAHLGEGQNPRCLLCHTTGFGEPGGWIGLAPRNAEKGVGCEACHGRGSEHAAARAAVRRDQYRLVPKAMASRCQRCHTPEFDPDFVPELVPLMIKALGHPAAR